MYLEAIPEQEGVAAVPLPANPPETDLPTQALSMRVMLYGINKHYKLFTPRQLTALTTFSDLIAEARAKVLADAQAASTFPADNRSLDQCGAGPQTYADAVATYLAFTLDKGADRWSGLSSWDASAAKLRSTFGRQALPMVWDFCEGNPFSDSSGSWNSHLEFTAKCAECSPAGAPASAVQRSATAIPHTPVLISTDPPYYDNIGYADLSDFFYIWLRRSLGGSYPDLFKTVLTPKAEELIATPYRHGGKQQAQEFFETGLGQAFEKMREVQPAEYPMTVFYAFKQSEETQGDETSDKRGRKSRKGSVQETAADDDAKPDAQTSHASTGWETMLAGLIRAGFAIAGTWPMRTELGNRMVGAGTNALASSIVLSCRPRPADAAIATRRDFIAALKRELPEALQHLQASNIAPVDLAQAAIGPGMAIFTRYSRVMEADGSSMGVRAALGLINQTLDDVLAEQEGDFDAGTRWALAWFEQFGMDDAPFGVAETLSKAKNTAVNALEQAGIIKARGGKVRLLKREELPADWDPAAAGRPAAWEITQQLIRALESGGETAAADLLRQLGDRGESARDLAYRLFHICERKGWAGEAVSYNSLVIAWPEISKLARAAPVTPETQEKMFQ